MPKSQNELPGVESPTIREIDDAADHYVSVRDKRMRLTEQEIAAKTNLIQVCLEHEKELSKNGDGNRVYRYGEEIVILSKGRDNVRVKHAAQEETGED